MHSTSREDGEQRRTTFHIKEEQPEQKFQYLKEQHVTKEVTGDHGISPDEQ